jgi:hypothetical protein
MEKGVLTTLPQLAVARAFDRIFEENDEAVTSQTYATTDRLEISRSSYWRNRARFVEARRRLKSTVMLTSGWDTYGAEAPSDVARAAAASILEVLETDSLTPAHLMASSEGGIAISFVEGDKRAEIELYTTGEVAVATYSVGRDATAWELDNTESAVKDAILKIRVHLAI